MLSLRSPLGTLELDNGPSFTADLSKSIVFGLSATAVVPIVAALAKAILFVLAATGTAEGGTARFKLRFHGRTLRARRRSIFLWH